MLNNGSADIAQFLLKLVRPDFRVFMHEYAEQADDGQTVQRFIPHGPGHNLPHALQLVEAREVQQNGEGRKKLKAFCKGTERCQRLGDLMLAVHGERLHVIVFILHFLILKECRIFRFGHAQRVQQIAVCRNMNGLNV